MTTSPAPEQAAAQVTLSDGQRAALHETSDHAPWHYTEYGVLCSCGLAIVDSERDYCQTMVNLEAAVEAIATAAAASARESEAAARDAWWRERVEALAREWEDDYPGPNAACSRTPDEWWRILRALVAAAAGEGDIGRALRRAPGRTERRGHLMTRPPVTPLDDAALADVVAELRAKAEAATPGPWNTNGSACSVHALPQEHVAQAANRRLKFNDAAYIAAANPATILALLDRLTAAEAALAEYGGWLCELTEAEWATPCRLDHNGDCQEHGQFGGPCNIPLIRAALAASPGGSDERAEP